MLTKYAETAYYGHEIYGCDMAAEEMFGHSLGSLTAAESALLVGVLESPSMRRAPVRALSRRQWILQRMHDAGALDDASLAAALAAPLGMIGVAEPLPNRGPIEPE